jgi:ribonuclease P protein component
MSQGFPKQARLLNGNEYTQVLRRAEKKVVDGPVQVKARKNSLDRARLGLVVPKRGTAKAHDRNQVKRIIREQFRLSRRQLPSLDIVVQVFGEISKQQLAQALRRQFGKLSGLSDGGPNN